MKAIFSIVGILFMLNCNAQDFDCSSKTKEYQDLFKAKKVNESFNTWTDVSKNCPKQSEALYTDGLDILQYKIDNATGEEKEKLVRQVLKLYDQYYKNFPLAVPDFEARKAMALFNNKIEAKEEIFNLLNSSFSKSPQYISDSNAIYTYFNLYFQKYTADSNAVTTDMMLDKYMQVNNLLSQLKETHPEKNREYSTAERGIHALAKDLTNCTNLAAYYEKNLESNKENAVWLSNALSSLSTKCGSLPVYNALAEANYKIKHTSKSAYYMGITSLKQRKFPEAIQYYTEAEELEPNPLEKAKLDYVMATGLLSNDKAKSKELINKALSFDPKMGKAYLFLGGLYANSAEECGTDEFQKKAIYYLAIETFKKALLVEARLKPTVEKMTQDYAAKALTPKDITNAKWNGKSYKINCWINETISFPEKQ